MSDDCFITGLHGAHVVSLSQRRSREKKQKGGVDEIISQLIQRRDGAECAGALAELSIQSPPQLGSKEARRWHASRKLISPHTFHQSPRAAPTRSPYAGTSLSPSYWNQFFPSSFVADLSLP